MQNSKGVNGSARMASANLGWESEGGGRDLLVAGWAVRIKWQKMRGHKASQRGYEEDQTSSCFRLTLGLKRISRNS